MIINKSLVALALASLCACGAQAAVVNSSAGFTVLEDFESFDNLVSKGPVALGGSLSVSSGIFSTFGAVAVDLVDNGTWGAGNRFAGIGDLSFLPSTSEGYVGSMTFTLAHAVQGLGATFSIFNDGSVSGEITLEALGAGDVVLESVTFAVDFDDALLTNVGEFRGFVRPTADILGLRVSGDGFVVDDVAAVPVPAALPLLAAALGTLSLRRRLRS
ncbi:MAG: hypothetical protein K2Y51_21155, partial [Gammaproteobacteria bacterium]|nr:hypothetical protein [Gammaproteobacteria bacterium]